MQGKRIKWGNVLILLLIVAAAVAAFYYKNPGAFSRVPGLDKNKTESRDSTGETEKNAEDGMPAEDEFVLGLDSWIGGTPALIALNREYNKDYSLNMKLKYIPNDGDRITALMEGEIHATEMSLPAFIRFQEKYPGSGTIVGITDFSRGADGIVARAEVKDLNDMEGRTVSYVGDGTGKFILNKFLRLTGLRYQDIKPIEHDEMEAVIEDLKAGNADLIVSWSPDMNLAVKSINAQKPGSVKMLITTKEVPNLVPTVLVVSKNAAAEHPERVEAFLKTWYASTKYIVERPEKAYEKLAELMNEKSDEYGEVTKEDVKESFMSIKLMALNDVFEYFGLSGKEETFTPVINDTVQTWKKYGDISGNNIDAKSILRLDFMQKLHKENDRELLVEAADPGTAGNAGQDSEPKKEFKKQDDASIEKSTERVAKVDIPPVYYDSGKATVKAESIAVLNEVLDILKQFPEFYLVVDAHTDSVGSDETNLKLSKDRASEVKKYFVAKGIDVNRVVARGWGEYRPVVSQEKTEEDRAKNRRTEFILTRDVSGK